MNDPIVLTDWFKKEINIAEVEINFESIIEKAAKEFKKEMLSEVKV